MLQSDLITIEDWSVVQDDEGAEYPLMCLRGVVFGHPIKEDGKIVITNIILESSGRIVKTASNHYYWLVGPPEREYQAYLDSIGYVLDEQQPIKIL